jgi:hypothetical protein
MINEPSGNPLFFPWLFPSKALQRSYTPHSHSIILCRGNALDFQRKFFLRTTKNRLADPSENCALDFKREFRRSAICSMSATIGIDRSIFLNSVSHRWLGVPAKNYRHSYCSSGHTSTTPWATAHGTRETFRWPQPSRQLRSRRIRRLARRMT